MKKHTTIFLDIDGTLIDINQRATTNTLPQLISDMKREGFQFGLNSNRSKEDVLSIITEFDLDGPFILENGAYILNADNTETILSSVNFNIPTMLVDALTTLFSNFDVECTNTTALYSEPNQSTGNKIYINKFRKYSGSIHHRIDGKTSYEFAVEISRKLNDYFNDKKIHNLEAVAHSHGHSLTIEEFGITKGIGIQKYKSMHPSMKIVAIGDGLNDLSVKDSVDELYAVANAHPALKKAALYTASREVTGGVEDILNRIKKLAINC